MEIRAEDIRPIADLKTKTGRLLRHVQNTQWPLLLTKKGKPTAVLLDVKEFASQFASRNLQALLKQAENEIAEGKGRDSNEFFEEFAKANKI